MKPGIFSDYFGFAGYLLVKKYKTLYWKPFWDHLGEWYAYSTTDCCINKVNTVVLNRIGEIKIRTRNYLSLAKAVRKQNRTLTAMQIKLLVLIIIAACILRTILSPSQQIHLNFQNLLSWGF